MMAAVYQTAADQLEEGVWVCSEDLEPGVDTTAVNTKSRLTIHSLRHSER